MSTSFRDDLVYPNLATCQIRVVGAGANARPPIQLPREVREAAATAALPSANGIESLDGFSLERAVLKRKEERQNDVGLRGATSREELERATIAKMKLITGADESICISVLRQNRYDVEESIEAYLEKM